MAPEPTLNAHNKGEFPLAHNTMGSSLIKRIVLLFGIAFLCGCNSNDSAENKSYHVAEIGESEDSIMNDTSNSLLAQEEEKLSPSTIESPTSPEIQYLKVLRELSDNEIDNLNFKECTWRGDRLVDYPEFIRWKDFVKNHKPYYSKSVCPHCGEHLLVIYSETDSEEYELSGQGGYFVICPHCKNVCEYIIVWIS